MDTNNTMEHREKQPKSLPLLLVANIAVIGLR